MRSCTIALVTAGAIVIGWNNAPAETPYPLPTPQIGPPCSTKEIKHGRIGDLDILAGPAGVKGYRDGKLVLEKSLYEALCDPEVACPALRVLDRFITPRPPSREILEKVKELAIREMTLPEDGPIANSLRGWSPVNTPPLLVLHNWELDKLWQRLRDEGYPIRGQCQDGLVLWLVEVTPSAWGIQLSGRIDNLSEHELHLYRDNTTWDLVMYDGLQPRKVGTKGLDPAYGTGKPYHIIEARQSLTMSFGEYSRQPLEFTDSRTVLLQVVLRGRKDGVADSKIWAGQVESPKVRVRLPPQYDSDNLDYWRACLTACIKKGAFPETARFDWLALYGGFGFSTIGNDVVGGGIWLAMPDDLRRLSQDEVRTICGFLLQDDVFAKGFENSTEYLGKYPPHELFSFQTDEKLGKWDGNWLKRDASERWQQILSAILRSRLKIARERLGLGPGEKEEKAGAEPDAPPATDEPRH